MFSLPQLILLAAWLDIDRSRRNGILIVKVQSDMGTDSIIRQGTIFQSDEYQNFGYFNLMKRVYISMRLPSQSTQIVPSCQVQKDGKLLIAKIQ